MIIKNGLIHDAVNKEPYVADIHVKDGKIVFIGKTTISENEDIFDASGLDVYPGFIDAHTHIGMMGVESDITKDDYEKSALCVPENNAIDAVNVQDSSFISAVRGGVTTVCTGPGSVNCIGGTSVAIKTVGNCIDKMIVRNPVAMKIAFGENPKALLSGKVFSRMTEASVIRTYLKKTIEYMDAKKKPEGTLYNPSFEALIPVIEKKIPLKAHVHRNDDIQTAIRIAKEFNLKLTLEHVSDCAMIVDEIKASGYPVVAGPYIGQARKLENENKSVANVAKLIQAGCQVSVMTDAPVISEEYLSVCAGLLLREGVSEFEALKTITINAAKHLGIEERVGSIEIGKDADFVISKGCPLLNSVRPCEVFVNGIQLSNLEKYKGLF